MLVRDIMTHSAEIDLGTINTPHLVTFDIILEVSEISESKIVFLVTIQPSEDLHPNEFGEIKRAYLEDSAVRDAIYEVTKYFGREAGSFEGVYNDAEGIVVVTPYVGSEF